MQIKNQNQLVLIQEFWKSPEQALFDQKTIAAVRCCSTSSLERERWAGDGIPYLKVKHKCLYRKTDVVNWLNQHQTLSSTSQYEVTNND